jgi:REP element-mobilizing transposase RayT
VPKAFYRRQLPHLQRDCKSHFLTFCTYRKWILPEQIRFEVLACCLHDDGKSIDLHAAIVMPDHVHMIFTPLVDSEAAEVCSLARVMNGIKGASAHKINRLLGRTGNVWQAESFDHVVRSSESLDQKIQYVIDNPVRRGLVRDSGAYPWLWHRPFADPNIIREPQATWGQPPPAVRASEARQFVAKARSGAALRLDSRGRLSPRGL